MAVQLLNLDIYVGADVYECNKCPWTFYPLLEEP